MANRKVKLVRPGDEQTTWRGAGDEYRVLATGEDTAGDYFIMEAIVPPGGGPPPHIQTLEEAAIYFHISEIQPDSAPELDRVNHPGKTAIVSLRGSKRLVRHNRQSAAAVA